MSWCATDGVLAYSTLGTLDNSMPFVDSISTMREHSITHHAPWRIFIACGGTSHHAVYFRWCIYPQPWFEVNERVCYLKQAWAVMSLRSLYVSPTIKVRECTFSQQRTKSIQCFTRRLCWRSARCGLPLRPIDSRRRADRGATSSLLRWFLRQMCPPVQDKDSSQVAMCPRCPGPP